MILETERLRLREYTDDDFAALFAIISDPETMKFFPKPYDEKGTKRWLEWSMQHYREHGFGFWAVELKETGELIGNCGLTMQEIDGELLPEIGYHFHKEYWRQGFGSEAARGVRDWAFQNTNYDCLYSYMSAANTASYAVAIASRMKKVKEFTDEDYDLLYACAITRGEWERVSKHD